MEGQARAVQGWSEDQLHEVLGAELLGEGLGVAPADLDRFRRFAKGWVLNKSIKLWRRVRETDAYRLWLETAGPGQVLDPGTLAGVLAESGEVDGPLPAAALAELLVRAEVAATGEAWDVAVSFAAEQRGYVERTVEAAKALGLRVFYDRDMVNDWWGRNFVVEQRRVYGQLALHFVPFLSAEYLLRPYPMDEFAHAMAKAVRQGDRYVLPVLVGDVDVPHELLHPHIGYLRAADHPPEELALRLRAVVAESRAQGRPPHDLGAIVDDAAGRP